MGRDCVPTLVMVILQLGFAGLNVVSKLALDSGMSPFVMVTYRQVVASLFLSPVAYFFERRPQELTKYIILQIFVCSVFGATANQILYFLGLKYSTPTIACALSNTLPAITFLMAVPFRMETVGIKTIPGQAKVFGTVICVGGSMLMTFYKGSLIKIWSSGIHWKYAETMTNASVNSHQEKMVLGALLVVASCVAWAVWFIIQAKMSKTYPSPYTSSAIMCSMASVECLIIGSCFERRISGWALGWDIRLAAAVYTGIVGSGLAFGLMSWCIERRGPLFVSMFSPLLLVIVAVLGWAILDEKLYMGSVVGSALIVGGLYAVLWGKGKELRKTVNGRPIIGYNEEEEEGMGSIGLPVQTINTITDARESLP